MKILVTGAKGQIGSELIQRGKTLGFQMITADHAKLDITRQQAVNIFINEHTPDLIINAAAYTAVDQAEAEPELAYAVNCDGATYLAQACNENNIPLFHISTDYIFDGSNNGAYIESDLPNPKSVYGKSKLAGDRAIEAVLEKHLILRVSWVFGANGNNFVKTMLHLAKEHHVLKIVSDQRGGPTWAGAIADTLLTIVKRWGNGEEISWGTYHYSGQPATTWQEFAETIFEQAEKLGMISKRPKVEPITTAEYPTAAPRPLNSVLDCQKIVREFAIALPDWRTGLDNVLGS